jgi:hypothetical protein
VAITAVIVAALAVAHEASDGDRGRPAPRDAGRSPVVASADRSTHVIPPRRRSGRLAFRIDMRSQPRVVAAWLQHERARRAVSVRTVAHAASRGRLLIRRPHGWSARRIRLVVRTAERRGVYGCGYGRFARRRWPTGCWRPYSARSPFNQRLPSAPQTAGDSEQLVKQILSFGPARHLVAGYADTENDYERPTYWAQPGDPLVRLHCYQASWGRCPIEGHRIRIPAAARPAAGGDGHLTVVDQDLGWEYDLYKVRSKQGRRGTLEFRWGGRTRIDGDGLRSGAVAARFGSLAGMVRAAELASGRIDHALFATVRCSSGRFVYPASGAGRRCATLGLPDEGAPPLGTRLQLAMSPDEIEALRVPAWKKTILRAMATYGMFVGDTGGGAWGLRMESGSTFTSFGVADPLVALARTDGWERHENVWVGNLRDGVPWSTRLRVIAPCVTRRSC